MKRTYIVTISTSTAFARKYSNDYESALKDFSSFAKKFEELKKDGGLVNYVSICVFNNGVNCGCETIKIHF